MLNEKRIQEIQQALFNSTPGPWRTYQKEHLKQADGSHENYRTIDAGSGYYREELDKGFGADLFISMNDAKLIVNAQTWIQQLLSDRVILQHQNRQLTDDLAIVTETLKLYADDDFYNHITDDVTDNAKEALQQIQGKEEER